MVAQPSRYTPIYILSRISLHTISLLMTLTIDSQIEDDHCIVTQGRKKYNWVIWTDLLQSADVFSQNHFPYIHSHSLDVNTFHEGVRTRHIYNYLHILQSHNIFSHEVPLIVQYP